MNNTDNNMNNLKNTAAKSEWNEIALWLQSLNYGNYLHLFTNGGYDLWEIIYDLNTNDLKDMGIKPGHAKRIEKLLKTRKDTNLNKINLQNIQNIQNMNNMNNHNINNQQQQLQELQNQERKQRMRDKFPNVLLAGNLKNKLFDTMTRVLNGLQQQLIEYNAKFAEPINDMNQRIMTLQRLENNNENILDCNECLFEPMIRNIDDIKRYNDNMWNKINFLGNLADSQINSSIKQLQKQISLTNQIKNEYILKQQQIYYKQPQQPPPPPSTIISRSNEENNQKNKTKMLRNPAYNSGELEMMKNYEKSNKKQTVAEIIELQRKMQSVHGIPRTAYGIAQKMYRMGVLSATLPKKLQALQDKTDDDKIKIGDKDINIHMQANTSTSQIIIRRYSVEETNFIRKLIEDYPQHDAKILFNKFRQRFQVWKDDTDSYQKFYQKKWRICKEKNNNNSCKKRKIVGVNININTNQPPTKKLKINNF